MKTVTVTIDNYPVEVETDVEEDIEIFVNDLIKGVGDGNETV
jgi:hypothetical protein